MLSKGEPHNPEPHTIPLSENKALYEILVPCNWNGGNPVRTRHHKEWDKKVRKITGGLTILKPRKGQWVHDGEYYEDRVIPVRIFCTQKQMEQISYITIAHYEQEAVMYYQIAEWCLIQHASPTQKSKFTHQRNTIPKGVDNANSTE